MRGAAQFAQFVPLQTKHFALYIRAHTHGLGP